jgi:cell division protein ZapA (FtsZ GTPase activity inhibitor)
LEEAVDRVERALLRVERAVERGAMTQGAAGDPEREECYVPGSPKRLASWTTSSGMRAMAEVELTIAGRPYKVACRNGEEETLQQAGALVDAKSREALAGLGTLSESRQLLFAALLLADQIIDGRDSKYPRDLTKISSSGRSSWQTASNHWPTDLSKTDRSTR